MQNEGGVRAPLGRMILVMLVALIGVTVGIAVPVERAPNEYESRSVVSFGPRGQQQLTGDMLQLLTAKYVAFLTAQATMREIAADTGERETALRKAVTVTQEPETANVAIDVSLPESDQAARVANAMAVKALRRSAGDASVRAEIIARAVVSAKPAGPPRRLIELVGFVLGLVVAGLIGAVWHQWRQWRATTDGSGWQPSVHEPTDSGSAQGLPHEGLVGQMRR